MVFLLHLVENVDGPITIKANSRYVLPIYLSLSFNQHGFRKGS